MSHVRRTLTEPRPEGHNERPHHAHGPSPSLEGEPGARSLTAEEWQEHISAETRRF
jgi:hypothetical protein